MARGVRDEDVGALQRRVEDIRGRRERAKAKVDEQDRRLRQALRRLSALGVEAPAPGWPLEPEGRSPFTEAPTVPEGWSLGPPDFVGVGTQRSGSTWWFRLVTEHPRAQPPLKPGRKELHYFDTFSHLRMTDEHVAGYHARLPRAPGHLAGEWTPRYMFDHWSIPLLARVAPRARLLVILRDPITRYRSGLSYALREGAGGGRQRATQATPQVLMGLYFLQLERVLRHFPRSQLLVLQYERCRQEPEAQLRRTWEFLGLDPGEAPNVEPGVQVGPKLAPMPLDPTLEAELRATLAGDVLSLVRHFPEIDLDLWPHFRHAG